MHDVDRSWQVASILVAFVCIIKGLLCVNRKDSSSAADWMFWSTLARDCWDLACLNERSHQYQFKLTKRERLNDTQLFDRVSVLLSWSCRITLSNLSADERKKSVWSPSERWDNLESASPPAARTAKSENRPREITEITTLVCTLFFTPCVYCTFFWYTLALRFVVILGAMCKEKHPAAKACWI